MKPQPLNVYEYEVLVGQWKGVKGAAYNAACEFCREMGYLSHHGIVTHQGREAIKAFQAEQNFRRIDVI